MAQSFNSGLPVAWVVVGTTGTSGANGVVTLAPIAGLIAFGWASTAGSESSTGYRLGGENYGSALR